MQESPINYLIEYVLIKLIFYISIAYSFLLLFLSYLKCKFVNFFKVNYCEMFNCSKCDSLKKAVDTKMPTTQCMSSRWQKDDNCLNQVNPWINLLLKIFPAVSQFGQKLMTGQITTAWINQNCFTCVVYMCGSKKTCAVYKCGIKIMCVSTVINIWVRKVIWGIHKRHQKTCAAEKSWTCAAV